MPASRRPTASRWTCSVTPLQAAGVDALNRYHVLVVWRLDRPRPQPAHPVNTVQDGPPARARHQPLRGPGLRGRRHLARTAAGVKMDTTPRPAPPRSSSSSSARRRPRAASTRPPSARTPAGPTPGRSAASTPGSTAALEDATLAAYLGEVHDQGRAPASAATSVAAACFRARLAGEPTPAGERTARVLAGYRRTAGSRGRVPARPFGAADLAAVLATSRAGAAAVASPTRSPSSAAGSTP